MAPSTLTTSPTLLRPSQGLEIESKLIEMSLLLNNKFCLQRYFCSLQILQSVRGQNLKPLLINTVLYFQIYMMPAKQ